MPLLASEVRFFSSGFIIERTHTVCLPITVCMELHVAEMWTVDAQDCLSLAYSKGFGKSSSSRINLPEPSVPEGLLVILRLKQFNQSEEEEEEEEEKSDKDSMHGDESDFKEADDDNDDDTNDNRTNNSRKNNASNAEENLRKAMMFNPLKRSLSLFCNRNTNKNLNKNNIENERNNSSYKEPHCIAFFVPTGSRASAALGTALPTWRATLRSIGVPEHRGGGVKQNDFNFNNINKLKKYEDVDDGSVPSGILRALITAIDCWSIAEDESGPGSLGFGSGDSSNGRFGLQNTVYDESIPVSSDSVLKAAKTLSNILGTGFLSMRYINLYLNMYD
jgi:hypothetical protein